MKTRLTIPSPPPPSIPSALILILVAAIGCSRQPTAPDAHPKDSGRRATDFPTNVTEYQVKGVLREILEQGAKARIAHEDIPGYMEAMTMLLDVRPTNELAGVQIGDQIMFRMLVTDDDGWIDHVKRTGVRIAPAESTEPKPAVAEEELEAGAPLPDCTLTNQLGQVIHLSDFKGQALAFTFIFTRCPFPTFCPRMNNNLAEVQKQLAAANVGTNWHLLSISFDPEYDTPERIGAYARGYGHDTAHWSFATGATADIRKLGNHFSLMFTRDGASFSHNVRTVVVDPFGLIQKVFAGNEWHPAELVAAMYAAMQTKSPTAPTNSSP